jgi:hypothetical protein
MALTVIGLLAGPAAMAADNQAGCPGAALQNFREVHGGAGLGQTIGAGHRLAGGTFGEEVRFGCPNPAGGGL